MVVLLWCRVVANLPEEVHWLCDKVEPTATGRQPAVEDEATRADSTMHAIMLLSFSDQEANQLWLKGRIAQQLARCPTCVEEFYSLKRRFYQKLLPCVYHRSSLLSPPAAAAAAVFAAFAPGGAGGREGRAATNTSLLGSTAKKTWISSSPIWRTGT